MIRYLNTKVTKNNVDRIRLASSIALESRNPHPWPSPMINKKRNIVRFNSIIVILKNLIAQLFPDETSQVRIYFSDVISWLESSFATNQEDFVKLQKDIFNYIKVSILSKNHEGRFFDSTPICSYRDYPRELDHLINLIHTTEFKSVRRLAIILLLSIFSVHLVLVVPGIPSLKSITDPSTGTDPEGKNINVNVSLAMLKSSVKSKEIFKKECENHEFHTTSAAGPNGHGLWAASKDAVALRNDSKVFENLSAFIKVQGLDLLRNSLDHAWTLLRYAGIEEEKAKVWVHSRLHLLQEKSDKARIIAIGDYYSQSALQPIHNTMSAILASIPNDSTFNQDEGFKKVLELTKDDVPLYSLDLSKATDRLPVALSERIVANITGSKDVAELWKKVLTDRTFITANNHRVAYKVGQPMGFLSSFTALALTHHVIVMAAAKKAGLSSFTKYVILGDDIVLQGTKVKDAYLEIMASLGVEISPTKSVYSEGVTYHGAEFCKRLALNGSEYTPLPVHSIVELLDKPELAPTLFDLIQKRKIFEGTQIYDFFSLILREDELIDLIRLNAMPKELSGLNYPMVHPEASGLDDRSLIASKGYGYKDVVNAYNYLLITSSIALIDSIAQRAHTALGILDLDVNTGPSEMDDITPAESLSLIQQIKAKIKVVDGGGDFVVHPAQRVIFANSKKLVALLSKMSATGLSFNKLLDVHHLDIFSNLLNKKATIVAKDSRVFGDRLRLAKAYQLLETCRLKDGTFRDAIYNGKVSSTNTLWTVKLNIGDKGLQVYPSVKRVTPTTISAHTNLLSAISKAGFKRPVEN